VILVDELAALAYVGEREVKRRIEYALGLLLSQGRAVGVAVMGCIQDPRKEVLPQRDLYPVRVCLRVTEAEHVNLVLGRGARDLGARADDISPSLPGVAFVQVDGVPEPVRVRFGYVTDDHIRTLAAGWRPPFTVIEGEGEAA
jgi:S-DNA-T family DNA segregation ATPase FtsK/SpoIIIE